jgi:SAM-dependent MidA family methyltransferase
LGQRNNIYIYIYICIARDSVVSIYIGVAALIIDYGHDHPSTASLRGIQKHTFVPNVLSEPGDIDLSIDVDFQTLRRYGTSSSKDVLAFGPIPQGWFLKEMGIEARMEQLLAHSHGIYIYIYLYR